MVQVLPAADLPLGVSPEEQVEDEPAAQRGQPQQAVPEVGVGGREGTGGLFHRAEVRPRRLLLQSVDLVAHGGEEPGIGPLHQGQIAMEGPGHLLGDILGVLVFQLEMGDPDPVGEGAGAGVKFLERHGFPPFGAIQQLLRKADRIHRGIIRYFPPRRVAGRRASPMASRTRPGIACADFP